MAAPAEMPHADEALKSLVERFKEAPGSPAFTELAAALLARGHAAEALRIAEHGLQLVPVSVDGRIERAAALLALGRPRVAFVELKRALAINPTNRRAMRLLGKVYVDAGTPGKAAELLAMRLKSGDAKEVEPPPDEEQNEPTHVTQSPFYMPEKEPTHDLPNPPMLPPRDDTAPLTKRPLPHQPPVKEDRGARPSGKQHTPPPPPHSQGAAIPDLFSDLTRDLGLSDTTPERPTSRVEVTQIIRRKPKELRPRSPSELAMIEGPIVDTTQPGQITEATGDLLSPPMGFGTEPPPLFEAVTSPRLQLTPFGLDDEPLFQEHMPFAVRPVEGMDISEAAGDLRETLDEALPPDLQAAFAGALEGPPPITHPHGTFNDVGDTLVEHLEETPHQPGNLIANAPDLTIDKDESDEEEDQPRFEVPGRPLVEIGRPGRRLVQNPRLELVVPRSQPSHVVAAIAGAVVMVLWLVLLFFYGAPNEWKPAWAVEGSKSEAARVSSGTARSEP